MDTSNLFVVFATSFVGCVVVLTVLVGVGLIIREVVRAMRRLSRRRKRAAYEAYYGKPVPNPMRARPLAQSPAPSPLAAIQLVDAADTLASTAEPAVEEASQAA